MASIFDIDGLDPPAPTHEPTPLKRSKKRESVTPAELASGKQTLYQMATEAMETLRIATREADWANAVKAAVAILDRSGFGPKSTVDVNTTVTDLSALSMDELAERAQGIANILKETGRPAQGAGTGSQERRVIH